MSPKFTIHRLFQYARAAGILLTLTLMFGCSSSGNTNLLDSSSTVSTNPADRIQACRSTDRVITGPAQCLQDDAACYEIANGQWCTGERGIVCPAGSSQLPAGATCPSGSRCFQVSESLECMI